MKENQKYQSKAFRYSNKSYPDDFTGPLDVGDNYGSSSNSSSGNSSSRIDWGNILNSILGIGNTFVSSYWNKSDKYRADAIEKIYKSERRTNTVLWVVIGLMLALGVVLVIRKTK